MEFKPVSGIKILYLIFAVLFSVAGILLLRQALTDYPINFRIFFFIVAFLLIAGSLRVLWGIVGTKLVVDSDSVTLIRLFSSRRMLLSEIGGYRVGGYDFYYLTPKMKGRSLRIPKSLTNKDMIAWITGRFSNVESQKLDQELSALLENGQFGVTREERQARLREARVVENAGSMAAFVLLLWAWLYPKPLGLLMLCLFLLPIAGIYMMWRFDGLLKFYKKRSSPYPSLRRMLILAIVGDFLLLDNYKVYAFSKNSWVLVLLLTILLTLGCLVTCWKGFAGSRRPWLLVSLVTIGVLTYSYFLLLYTNCYYDRSTPAVSIVTIVEKREAHGKTTTYYINLSAWGYFRSGKEETVSRSLYQQVHRGDSIAISLYAGKWGIPWYTFRKAD